MNINNHPDIAGIPARGLRDALRRMNPLLITADDLGKRLHIPSAEAASSRGRILIRTRDPELGLRFENTGCGGAHIVVLLQSSPNQLL